MIKLVVSILLIAACGGKGGGDTTPPSNTGGTPAAVSDPWAAVTTGATFTFDNRSGELSVEAAHEITATVTDVTPTADGRVIRLAWSSDGAPLDYGPPSTFTITKTTVRFDNEQVEFPLAEELRDPGGRTVTFRNGAVCYEEGPAEDAGDCSDVCFADFCVDAKQGLVGGGGLWWPNYSQFDRPDLRAK
jgi:hypothetical protein